LWCSNGITNDFCFRFWTYRILWWLWLAGMAVFFWDLTDFDISVTLLDKRWM
jgi:hypothetical protein